MAEPRPRRGHGEDSMYFDHANNYWVAAVSLGYKAGKRVRRKVTGRTKTEVKTKLRNLRRDLDSGVRSSATYTVGNALDDWLANGLSGRSDRTKELYTDTVKPLKEQLGERVRGDDARHQHRGDLRREPRHRLRHHPRRRRPRPGADVRGLISLVIVAVTVVFQLTVVDRIAFPGGSGPDLVLVVVAALALASGPVGGGGVGFWGRLALDVAPPGSHFTGQDALVFCLIGYACGLLADDSSRDSMTEPGHTALFEIVVTAVGAICGEALVALLGVMLSDPRVTWPAITD